VRHPGRSAGCSCAACCCLCVQHWWLHGSIGRDAGLPTSAVAAAAGCCSAHGGAAPSFSHSLENPALHLLQTVPNRPLRGRTVDAVLKLLRDSHGEGSLKEWQYLPNSLRCGAHRSPLKRARGTER